MTSFFKAKKLSKWGSETNSRHLTLPEADDFTVRDRTKLIFHDPFQLRLSIDHRKEETVLSLIGRPIKRSSF